ncbi:alpha/beta hydrolase [Paraburkholderia acidisoli]|uniref:alpha/beta hydrolase n=1 Tax=Paraburkholderia acidisoli TaxID=2571748 RepID=UPI0018EEEE89|nr:alpha/beta hydrolase [Paraburkholderia acidisoli]
MSLIRPRSPWQPLGCALLAVVASMPVHAQGTVPTPAAESARQVAVHDLALQDGASQRVLFYAPGAAMRGLIVMFPGGAGDVGIEQDGQIRNGENFVVRTRERWAQRGYGVLIVDAIGRESLRGERSTPQYAAVVREVLAYAHTLTDRPVWVMGTSQGAISAMRAASMAQAGELAGVVLSESVSVLGRSHETVFDVHPEAVRIPALVVANRDDRCRVAPPSKARDIAAAMPRAQATVLMEEGGNWQSNNACSSGSPHGYWGIDAKVVDDIDQWLTSVAAARSSDAASATRADQVESGR